MFCCRASACLDGDQPRKSSKGQSRKNRQFYLQQNSGKSNMISANQNYKTGNINYVSSKNTNVFKPNVKHVTNVQKDVYLKLNGMLKNSTRHNAGHVDGKYEIVHIAAKSNHRVQNYADNRPRLGSQMVKTKPVKTIRESMRLSTEFQVSGDDNRTSTPFPQTGGIHISDDEALAIFTHCDDDSLSEDQREALEQLDDTLNDYQIEDDDDTPMIIADVLPPGVFEASDIGECPSPGTESSEEEPSSGASSLSKSANSRTGIISQKQCSAKSRNSVSFKLPDGHVDKPYAPMQTCAKTKQKNPTVNITVQADNIKHAPSSQSSALLVTGSDVNVWHTGNKVYVESNHQRRISGPFKGSFKSLFYRKYSTSEFNSYNEKKIYLAPKIMEKVESFESLTGENVKRYQGNSNVAITRRHTYR